MSFPKEKDEKMNTETTGLTEFTGWAIDLFNLEPGVTRRPRPVDAYEDDESFLRLRELKKTTSSATYPLVIKKIEQAIGYNHKGITSAEQKETIEILAAFNPIVWDLAQTYVDPQLSYSMYLKSMIIALEDHASDIKERETEIWGWYLLTSRVPKRSKKYEPFIRRSPPAVLQTILFFLFIFAVIFTFVGILVWLDA